MNSSLKAKEISNKEYYENDKRLSRFVFKK